ncbi:MAG: rhodanese-like domain-containing protein [Chromatiaceae bacterium]
MNRALGRLLVAACVPFVLAGWGRAQAEPDAATFEDVARAIIHGQDQVGVDALADWIIQGKRDFMLVDIRPQEAFAAGHIKTAQSMPLTYLVERQTISRLPRDRMLILYSNGNREASQAVVMLRLAGFDAYSLLGGYDFWSRHVLHPELPANAGDDEILRYRKQQAVACYFAGNYKGGTAEAPSGSVGFTPPVYRKPPTREKKGTPKIKEGC